MTTSEDYGFTCSHLALGCLVLVGLASSELSGAGTVVALPIAGLAITLSAWCNLSVNKKSVTRKRSCGDVVDFLAIWMNILEYLAAAATCARVASATIDYTSDGRLRDLLFGLESHSLGEPWPDVLGVTIIVVITALFMLGLEKSTSFSWLLYIGISFSFIFFVSIGGYHTDIKFWNWKDDFMLRNWSCVITTSAMCSYGFVNNFPNVYSNNRRLKLFLIFIIPLVIYTSITLVFTFMSHYRELAGTAIPLVRVFEVRDVDWARPVMAVCTICVVCIALTEIIPSLYNILVQLAGKEWQVLVVPLLYRSSVTGAPILAIFTGGSLISILAFACPLSYLVRLLNISTLLKCSLKSLSNLYFCYKPEFPKEESSVYHGNVQYSKLNKAPKKVLRKTSNYRLKLMFDMFPRYMRHSAISPNAIEAKASRSKKEVADDKEYLLLDDYNATTADHYQITTDVLSDSESNNPTPLCSDGEDSSSSTDIDIVVQEYKEKIQVATINTFTENRTPTTITCRTVAILTFLIFITSSLICASILLHILYLTWISTILTLLSIIIILLMPQKVTAECYTGLLHRRLIPYFAICSIILNNILATTLLTEIWLGIVLWTIAGLIMFCRCNCLSFEWFCAKDSERTKLQTSSTECSIPEIQQYKDKYMDTILIQR